MRWSRTGGPRIFIGSSSESIDVARSLSSILSNSGYRTELWNSGVFVAGETYIESLERALMECDFALLIVTADDISVSRGNTSISPRDNVLFELGLFMGVLGRRRALMVVQRDATLKIPTDLLGLSAVTFRRDSVQPLRKTLDATALEIEEVIKRELALMREDSVGSQLLASVQADGYPGGALREGALAIAINGTRRGELFVVSADGSIMHSWEASPRGPISSWSSFGESSVSGLAASTFDGRVTLVCVNAKGQLCIRSQAGLSGSWGRWQRLTPRFTGPVALSMTKAGPAIFAVRGHNRLVEIYRTADKSWTINRELIRLSRPIVEVNALLSSSARAELVLRDENGRLWHMKELEQENEWSEGVHLSGVESSYSALEISPDGLTILFSVTPAGDILWCRQRHVTGDHWGPWTRLVTDLKWRRIAAMPASNGFLLVGAAQDDRLHFMSVSAELIVQDAIEGDTKVACCAVCEGGESDVFTIDLQGNLLKVDTTTLQTLS
jgi:CAP12/Pycsar effector protein, TIR domain